MVQILQNALYFDTISNGLANHFYLNQPRVVCLPPPY